ncbi:unnamed protein product [Rotaria sp. Silwood1]|nr:unnamed protein product [Rotaria sp. Silwood1]CAF4804006.1 unnamed protein product [Rotaria sp. Silwood1]
MVIPFSNTKLRVPTGFQSLLVGLSTEILRSQPRNIHEFAADYFEKLLQRRERQRHEMGACTSKVKKNKEKHLKNDTSTTKKNLTCEQSSSINVDKFDNVPFIDSEEKLAATPPRLTPSTDNDEQTTVKNDFETNQSYSNIETIDKLKQEVLTFVRENILSNNDEKQKLIDYVHKRIIGNVQEKKLINEYLEECFNHIQENHLIDNDDKIKQRLMNMITIYVASQSPDNSFLKALYDKMGSALDLNSLNAEINEHEVVNVTVTKRVRQVFLDDSSSSIPNQNSNTKNTVIHLSNNEHNIPDDLPDDIKRKAEQYLSSIIYHLEQGQSYLPDKQTSLEDRYYNNQSFQEEYRVNDPEVNNAATKIQANFRGHKARQNLEKMKHENKEMFDADQQELGYGREQTETPNENEYRVPSVEDRKSSPLISTRSEQQEHKKNIVHIPAGAGENDEDEKEDEEEEEEEPEEPEQIFERENSEAEREEQEIAARAIQAGFRGSKDRRSAHREQESPGSKGELDQLSDRRPYQDVDNERTPTPRSTRLSEKLDSDRHDLGGNLTADDQIETGENDDTDRPRLEREPTQLSEDFERHTQVPRDSDFDRELQPDYNNEGDDMDHSNLDKAATRIQASYRGYKTRKELGSIGTHEQHPSSTSPRTHDEYDNAHNKILSASAEYSREPEVEDDDNAAATKIQAAYRGYRVRKDLEK